MSKYQPDYRLTPKELLVALINNDNGTYYNLNEVSFGTPKELIGDPSNKGTVIDLAFAYPPLPQSFEEYKYDRIILSVIFETVLKDPSRRRYGFEFYKDTHGDFLTTKFIEYVETSFGFTIHNLGTDFKLEPLADKYHGVLLTPSQTNIGYVDYAIIPLLPPLVDRVINNNNLSFAIA